MAIGITALALGACGQSGQPTANVTSPGSPSPSAQSSATPFASPAASPTVVNGQCSVPQPLQDLCVGRAATAQEQQAILAAGRPAVESKYQLKTIATCQTGDRCLIVGNPLIAIIGTNAAVFGGAIGRYPDGSLGCTALIFLSYDSAGWHYVNSGCVQNGGFMPGNLAHVFVASGCVNVRTSPSLTAGVVACLTANTQVAVDSAPVYSDGHIWWHLGGKGWMVHDYLVAPSI